MEEQDNIAPRKRGRPPKAETNESDGMVEVICTCRQTHVGDGRVLQNRERAMVPVDVAALMEEKEQVVLA